MHTLTPASACSHTTIRVSTRYPTEFVDLTDQLETLVAGARLHSGLVNVQSLHTTTAVIVNEHEPLLLEDFAEMLAQVAPRELLYRHDDLGVRTVNLGPGERANGHAHCRALLLGPGVCLNIVEGRLQLGRWQRVFFVELDGPQTRALSIVLMGETAR